MISTISGYAARIPRAKIPEDFEDNHPQLRLVTSPHTDEALIFAHWAETTSNKVGQSIAPNYIKLPHDVVSLECHRQALEEALLPLGLWEQSTYGIWTALDTGD